MQYTEQILQPFIEAYSCCEFRAVSVRNLPSREKSVINNFMQEANTAIVIGHPIRARREWRWFAGGERGEHCEADDHTERVIREIIRTFSDRGYETKSLPYPEECGLQFRYVARAAGMGELGWNAFLLHPQWGPWIHLRVLVTQAATSCTHRDVESVCTNCGACIDSCPAGAITAGSFNGLQCRAYRKQKGEYIPFGKSRELRYCEICAEVCPIGKKPD